MAMHMSAPRLTFIVVTLVTLLLLAGFIPSMCAAQQTPSTSNAAANNTTRGLKDPAELEAFLNQTIENELQTYHIPGATVAVVKEGQLFFAKGYGYANLENHTPVDANTTLFGIGSITKLFTWTAVMQLVEEGKIDLNADVNTYLSDFKIPNTYPQPITMENLMTHTAGFENKERGFAVSNISDLQPLGTALASTMPARVFPPGQVWSYSNWGTALAAHIVEQVSGMPFAEYANMKLFVPLGMNHTTIEQPVQQKLAQNVSTGYTYDGGTYTPTPEEILQVAPAGAIMSTAPDMAKFLIAHLQNGRYEDIRILNNSTAIEMHSSHFTPDPRASWALGIGMMTRNNEQILWHNGDTNVFHAYFVLLPTHNVGLFVSYNGPAGTAAREDLLNAFLDRYYPVEKALPQLVNYHDASSVTGTYLKTRSAFTTIERYLLKPQLVEITGRSNGTLQINMVGQTAEYVEVAPLVFTRADGAQTVYQTAIFKNDGNGTHLFYTAAPQYYNRLPWYSTPAFVDSISYLSLALLPTVAIWPIRAVLDYQASGVTTRQTRWAHWTLGIASALFLAFFGAISSLAADETIVNNLMFSTSVPSSVVAALFLPLIGTALTFGAVAFTVLAWLRGYWNVWDRVHYTVVTAAALAFIAWLNYWNLIGFKW
jgi:CubicO group peptidase (beta-lactamase class C family)